LGHLADVLFAMAMLGFAILSVVRPAVVLRWARRAHPQIAEDNEAALWIARLVGVAGFAVALFFFVIIVRSL
jgi:hypothetical protein